MGHNKSSSKREVSNNTSLSQETWKISDKLSNHTPKGTKKKKQHPKSKLSVSKEIIKIKSEINEIETKTQ